MTVDPPPPESDPAKARRARLLGRLMLVALGLLLLAYIIPTVLNAHR